ncbi:MAG: protein kinase [Myxococcota bacterium]
MARIAVADDDQQLRSVLVRLLKQKGHDVTPFPDGGAALQGVRPGGYELLITDVEMPNMDGVNLTRALRQTFTKSQLPIIILSGLEAEDDILRGYDAGANDYLVKPYKAPILHAKVALLLREREAQGGANISLAPSGAQGPRLPFTFDKYTVEQELGRGGMSVVYRAVRRSDGKMVALKMFEPDVTADRQGLARYFREIAALSTISSERVVSVVDSGFEQGRYFLAMDYLEGRSAKAILLDEGPFPERRVVQVGRDVVDALQALRGQGLVHRDIKPANIMIRRDGRSTLVDLGLAKSQKDDDVTGSDAVLGTPQYLAPELLRGMMASVASDVYSLGVTLYELLSGQKPYAGLAASAVVQNKLAGKKPPTLREVQSGVSAPVASLVGQMMELDPDRRLRDLDELQEALEEINPR